MEKEYDVFGISNLLVDYVAKIDEEVLKEFKLEKNVMNQRNMEGIKSLESKLKDLKKYSGGSASNVVHGIANLGLKSALGGCTAKDEDGNIFVKDLEEMRIKNCIVYKEGYTGVAVSLVTPDGERTFIVNYGVADDYKSRDIDKEALSKSKYLHFTGYEFESMNKAIKKAVKLSKKYGTKISFDLGDPNVVLRNKKEFEHFLKKVDLVFANEEEAKNFTGESEPEKALEKLAKYCEVAVVKLGEKGAMVRSGDIAHKVKSFPVSLVNTIGAGDGFAAGFLYGLCNNHDLKYSCKLGDFYACKVVEETGARLSYSIPNLSWLMDISEGLNRINVYESFVDAW